jgi:hypothetical protein
MVMDAETLFLERCNQIQILAQSSREIEILDIGGRLRQLFLDDKHLISTANKDKVKLRFDVGQFSGEPDPYEAYVTYHSLEDGVDPYVPGHERTPLRLTMDDFLAHHIMTINGKRILVKDIIFFTSHVAGSIHFDPKPRKEFEVLAEFAKFFSVGGLPGGTRILTAIARVALRGLQPLIDNIKARRGL